MTCTPLAKQLGVQSGANPGAADAAVCNGVPRRCTLASSAASRSNTDIGGRAPFPRMPPANVVLQRRVSVTRSSGALRSSGSLVFSEAPAALAGDSLSSRCPSESLDGDESDVVGTRPTFSSSSRPTTRRKSVEPVVKPLILEPSGDPEAEEACGLTAASLKHLKRQRDALSEERGRLLEEIERLKAMLKEQTNGVNTDTTAQLSALIREKHAAIAALKAESDVVHDMKKQLEIATATILSRDSEIMQLQESLAAAQKSIQDSCADAQEPPHDTPQPLDSIGKDLLNATTVDLSRVTHLEAELAASKKNAIELQTKVKELRQTNRALEQDCRTHEEERAKMVDLNVCDKRRRDDDRDRVSDIVTRALNSNIVLNICLPHTVLRFGDGPPVVVGAEWMPKKKLHAFVNEKVFPAFETVWVRLDGSDERPDGTSQAKYKDRALDLLTDAVDKYVSKFLAKSWKDWETKFSEEINA